MAIKGVATITGVLYDPANPGDIRVQMVGCGLDTSNLVNVSVFATDVPSGLVPSLLDSALKNAMKNKLINDYGYSFGILDTINLVPGVI